MQMSESEISELLSLEQNMSVFHPINSEERMKTFINESIKNQQKISELESILNRFISKVKTNEKDLYMD